MLKVTLPVYERASLKSQSFYLTTAGNFRFFGSTGILIQGWGKDVTKGGRKERKEVTERQVPATPQLLQGLPPSTAEISTGDKAHWLRRVPRKHWLAWAPFPPSFPLASVGPMPLKLLPWRLPLQCPEQGRTGAGLGE